MPSFLEYICLKLWWACHILSIYWSIFSWRMGTLCNVMNTCVNASLECWKSLPEIPWLFLCKKIYHQSELQRFLLHNVSYVIKSSSAYILKKRKEKKMWRFGCFNELQDIFLNRLKLTMGIWCYWVVICWIFFSGQWYAVGRNC